MKCITQGDDHSVAVEDECDEDVDMEGDDGGDVVYVLNDEELTRLTCMVQTALTATQISKENNSITNDCATASTKSTGPTCIG